MRYPAAYYFLLLYSTLILRCAAPVACDTLSHFFNEEAHIATVHAVYGSHHLQSAVAGTVADTQPSKHNYAQVNEPTIVHTCPAYYRDVFVECSLSQARFPSRSYPLCSVSRLRISEPPESC